MNTFLMTPSLDHRGYSAGRSNQHDHPDPARTVDRMGRHFWSTGW
jgi:hypothetical protein